MMNKLQDAVAHTLGLVDKALAGDNGLQAKFQIDAGEGVSFVGSVDLTDNMMLERWGIDGKIAFDIIVKPRGSGVKLEIGLRVVGPGVD